MGTKKEINEKTFELNITSELLDLSKSFCWYLNESPISPLFPKGFWRQFLSQNVLFATGLTQDEESSVSGGYDVSINYKRPNQFGSSRLLFLQYKAGVRKKYCTNINSKFNVSQKHIRDIEHVYFTFNDAANKQQHIILRNLAKKSHVQSDAVMYVFPRVTEKTDFENKVGNLLPHTSFVPVLDIDLQAASYTPSVTINSGTVHKYRTSYDGKISEVNFHFFFFFGDPYIMFRLLSELICVQIERFAIAFRTYNRKIDIDFINWTVEAIDEFLEDYFDEFKSVFGIDQTEGISNIINLEEAENIIKKSLNEYIKQFDNGYEIDRIPKAPQKYSFEISSDGLLLSFEDENLDNIQYQVF